MYRYYIVNDWTLFWSPTISGRELMTKIRRQITWFFVARLFGLQYMLVFPGPNSNLGFTSNRMGPGVPGPEGNPYYINILYLFTYIYACFAASAASPAPTHPSIKESTKVGQAPKAPAPLLWRRPKAASFMDGCVGAWEAADAAKHV